MATALGAEDPYQTRGEDRDLSETRSVYTNGTGEASGVSGTAEGKPREKSGMISQEHEYKYYSGVWSLEILLHRIASFYYYSVLKQNNPIPSSAMSTAAALPILAKTSSWVESHPSPAISNRQFGTVKSYNGEQGFGLIVSDFGGELILRQQSLANGDISLKEGMKVSYEPVHGPILLMADKVQAEE